MNNQKEEVFNNFVKERLGGLAGKILLKKYLKELNIRTIQSLDEKQLVKFSDYFIYHIFKNHLPAEEINSIRLQLNLQLCFTSASEKISKMMKTEIYLNPFKLKYESNDSVDMLLNSLSQDITAMTIEINGYIKGTFILFLFRESAINLADLMLKTMLGQESNTDGIDEMKESAIKEFMNIMISTFIESISNTINKKIVHTIKEYKIIDVNYQIAECIAKINTFEDGEAKIKKLLSTELDLDVKGIKIQGLCLFLLENEGKALSSTISESDIKKDKILKDIKLENIKVNTTVSKKESIIELIENFFPGEGNDIVETCMEKIKVGGFTKIPTGIKTEFTDFVIETYFNKHSNNVKVFVRQALDKILDISTIDSSSLGQAKEKTTKKVDKDILERLIRYKSQ